MHRLNIALLFASLLWWVLPLIAREPGRFQHGDQIPGRPPVAVAGIEQDSFGFLWFGSEDGLYRYDGFTSKVYRHEPGDQQSLSSSAITDILEDRHGSLWFATNGGGLNRFVRDDEGFEHFRHGTDDPHSLSHDNVWCLLEDHSGTLWVGTTGGLHRYHAQEKEFTRHLTEDAQSTADFAVVALFEDEDHHLWVGTTRGLARFAEEETTWYRHDPEDPSSLSHNEVTAIAPSDGSLWIGTSNGLHRFDPETEVFQRYLHDPEDPHSLSYDVISDLHVDPRGRLWIATFGGGLDRYDPKTGHFTHHRNQPDNPFSLSGNGVVEIYQDRSGILWLGTYGGLNRYDPRQEQFEIFTKSTLGQSWALALWLEPSDILWVGGTDQLTRIDRKSGTTTRYLSQPGLPGSLPRGYVTSLLKDARGVLWVGTWEGLCRLDEGRGFFTCYRRDAVEPSSLPSNSVLALFEDRQQRMWVGTDQGVGIFDSTTERFRPLAAEPGVPEEIASGSFSFVTEDRGGVLWLGSDQGLYSLQENSTEERIRAYAHDPEDPTSLANNRVTAIHEDGRGALWVATFGGGLDRLDRSRGTFAHYTTENGLPSNTVTGILEDDRGRLWLGTYDGLSRFDPEKETFRNYDSTDGLLGNVLNSYSFLKGSRGEMFFGTNEGLNAFFPGNLVDDPQPPPVVLTELYLFDKPAKPRREGAASPLRQPMLETRDLTFSHRQNVFAFEFVALDFRNPQKNQYAYRLEGFDRDWVATSPNQRVARYTNLDAGHYTFRVRASNADGVWNEEGAAVRLTVLAPPWKTWWAYALYALTLVAVASILARAQRRKHARERALQHQEIEQERRINRRLREIDKLKDEFLANTSHELRTPLYGITGLAESLIDGARGALPDAACKDLSLLVASGQRLSVLVNDLLDFSKLRHRSIALYRRAVDVRALAEVVLTLSRPLVGSKDLQLENSVPEDVPTVHADENRLQQILYNLVGNAIKFTKTGTVTVAASFSSEHDPPQVSIWVTDTGIGISKDIQDRIFEAFEQGDASTEREFGGTGLGLAVTRQLVELHGGVLEVESIPGEGSTFRFNLPVSGEPAKPGGAVTPRLPVKTLVPEPSEAPGATPNTPRDETAPPPLKASSRILVVDDEPVIRQVLVNQLTTRGYVIEQASGGSEALTMVRDQAPDLVLLDVMMPRMSGYEVCRTLRQEYPIEELPVIFLTAKNQVEDLVVGLAAGANDYLPKPISKNELLSRVKTHLDLLSIHRQLTDLVAQRTNELGERERLLLEREKLVGELEARNSELARFNYTVSHDLKNPLVTIKNFLGMVRHDAEKGESDRLGHHLTRLETAADQMHQLLDELFEFSRVGVQANPPVDVPFEDLVNEAQAQLRNRFDAAGAELVLQGTFPRVRGDHSRLVEMMRHLLDNALKHRGQVNPPRIEVGTRSSALGESSAVFYVRDNGEGIQPEYQEKIFGLFERLHPETSPGTGIGLALVRRIVEVHGGRIWVESEGLGRGSTFLFTLE